MTTVNGNGGSPTYFLYDGTRVLCELDASGNVTAAYGYGGAGLAQRYSVTTATYTAYTFDPMGNVVSRMRQVDAPSVPYDVAGYDAFGSRFLYTSVQQNNTVPPDSVGYGGQLGNYTDVEANLILMGFRFYSPFYCRFLTRDPSGYGGGINLYAYCRNNPINRFDPLGLQQLQHLPEAVKEATTVIAPVVEEGAIVVAEKQVAKIAVVGVARRMSLKAGLSFLAARFAGPVSLFAFIPDAYQIGQGLGNHYYGPQTLDSTVDSAYSSLYQSLRNCFVAGTQVAMADGTYKPIETLHEGARVLSRDPFTGQTSAKMVLQTFARDVEQTLVLRFDTGEQIETTPGHPFYVAGKGFVLAGQLALGNAIVTRAGPAAILTGIQNKTERVRVYNVEVADFHTYFVGSHHGGLYVHNLCRPFASNALLNSTLIDEMFRGVYNNGSWTSTDLYPGGLAGAVRRQLATGQLVGGRDHIQKGDNRLTQMKKILKDGAIGGTALSDGDIQIVRRLHNDLQRALQGR